MALDEEGEFKNVLNDTLARHNFYREKHNVGPLKINPKINKISQEWADILMQNGVASHRPDNAYGENIYVIKSMDKVIELGIKAVDCWYGEIEFFDFQVTNEQMAATSKALHFTQVVWKDSKELGVGASKSAKTGEIYLVCNYDLPGNVESDFKNNVLPPKSS